MSKMMVPVSKPEENEVGDVHEIKEGVRGLEPISESHFNILCNPLFHAFKNSLKLLEETQNPEIIDQMGFMVLEDDISKIEDLIPELLPYLRNENLYQKICILLSDSAHLNESLVEKLCSKSVFDYLDFSKTISTNLVLSICDCNPQAWQLFKEKYLTEELKSDIYIQKLL